MGHEKQSKQLGMSFNKARHILFKTVLFDLIKKQNLDNCYRCGKKIEFLRELSIEHKVPWLNSPNPAEVYFDLTNIAFSHLSCNSASTTRQDESLNQSRRTKISEALSKIKAETVNEIKSAYGSGVSIIQLAAKYNVHKSTIWRIVSNQSRIFVTK